MNARVSASVRCGSRCSAAGGAAEHVASTRSAGVSPGIGLRSSGGVGLLELRGQRRDQQVDLGGEVAVERAEGDVGLLGDGPHLHRRRSRPWRRARWSRPGSACGARAGRPSPGRRGSASSRSSGPTLPDVTADLAGRTCLRTRSEASIASGHNREHVPVPHLGRRSGLAHRTAVLPQQAALRRPGRLRPSPQPRAGRPRPRRRGVLRPALPRARRRASRLTEVPSLDLYREPDPFRTPRPARVPRPGSTSQEVADHVRRPASPSRRPSACAPPGCCADRVGDFDVVHDNQTLGYGMLDIERARAAAGHHHPPPDHRSTAASTSPRRRRWRKRLTLRRWYGFLRMQGRVARRLPPVLHRLGVAPRATSSRDFGVDRARIAGDPARRRRRCSGRRPQPRVPGRIVAMASADAPMKGIAHAARGVRQAAHRARRRAGAGHPARARAAAPSSSIDRLGIADAVRFVHGISDAELVELMGSAEVACVPSLYEGFSLPTAELMACAHAAGGQPRRRDPRGRRARRRVRRPGHARRRRRARRRARRAARRPRAAGADGRGRPRAGRWSSSAGARWPRPPPRPTRRRSTLRRGGDAAC